MRTPPPQDPHDRRPTGAAQGIMLALLLSVPAWAGLGVAVWAVTRP
jgi:hypothetical protein